MTDLERTLRNLSGCDLPIATEVANRIAKLEQQLAAKDAELDEIKGGEFERRIQKVADNWRGKCDRFEQQLAEREKQIVMLQEVIDSLVDFWTTVGGSSSYWEEVWPEKEAALDLTSDLSGLILCDAEPFGYVWPTGMHPLFRFFQHTIDGAEGMPLYKVKEMK